MAIIDRSGAEVLIPEEHAREIIQMVPEQSTTMRLMTRLPDMGSKTRVLPVLSSLPMAYFVDGDTGFKQTTSMAWQNVKLHAEEIACIVPIPINVLDDSEYDIWANVLPRIVEAIGARWDSVVLFGTNKPTNFPDGLIPSAIDAGNVVSYSASGSLYQQLLGDGGVASLVEEDGYVPTGYVGHINMRSKLRGTVDNNGLPIFGRTPYVNGVNNRPVFELDSNPIYFPRTEVMNDGGALLIGGDWTTPVWAMRTDITTRLLTEAVIQDPTNQSIVYNLAQQDMVALRVTFRAGWAMPKPINRLNMANESRFPFAVLIPSTTENIEAALYNVTAPVKSATPQATHDAGLGYTATIAWTPAASTFAGGTTYAATVTLNAADGFIFPARFGAADVVGLPETGESGTATSVSVVRMSGSQVKITVIYKPTAA